MTRVCWVAVAKMGKPSSPKTDRLGLTASEDSGGSSSNEIRHRYRKSELSSAKSLKYWFNWVGRVRQTAFRSKSVDQIMKEMEHRERSTEGSSSGEQLDVEDQTKTTVVIQERTLSALDLVLLGIGCMVGAGIFVLVGTVAKEKAGPGVVLSYLMAGFACLLASFCYAEFAARIPVSGSAYVYCYTALGELMAFLIGWNMILEYTVGAATVARSWSGYFNSLIGDIIPQTLLNLQLGPLSLNFVSPILVAALTWTLIRGMKGSARLNSMITYVNLVVIAFAIVAGLVLADWENVSPFTPFGFHGVFSGAATVFFSFIGFDSVSTTAEEVKSPQRDLPIGIVGSLVICTGLYMLVAFALTAMTHYSFIDTEAPLAVAFADHNLAWAEKLISVGAFAALTSTVLVLMMSQPRIYLAMARDGLIVPHMGKLHESHNTPAFATVITGAFCGLCCFLLPIETLADLVSIGTLSAFSVVSAGVILLRIWGTSSGRHSRRPLVLILLFCLCAVAFSVAFRNDWPLPVGLTLVAVALIPATLLHLSPHAPLPTTFKCPLVPTLPLLSISCNIYLMASLSLATWIRFLVWSLLGFVCYVCYGSRHTRLTGEGWREMEEREGERDGGSESEGYGRRVESEGTESEVGERGRESDSGEERREGFSDMDDTVEVRLSESDSERERARDGDRDEDTERTREREEEEDEYVW